MKDYYQTEDEIAAVVSGFENCTTSKEGFTHVSHLIVACFYLCHSTPDETFAKMRFGLLRFLDHHGVGLAKYDDRLTRTWIERIKAVIEELENDTSLVEATNTVLERLSNARVAPEDQLER